MFFIILFTTDNIHTTQHLNISSLFIVKFDLIFKKNEKLIMDFYY
jgi:hypothetical protein